MNNYLYTQNFHKLKDVFKVMTGNHFYKFMRNHWATFCSNQSSDLIFITQSSD